MIYRKEKVEAHNRYLYQKNVFLFGFTKMREFSDEPDFEGKSSADERESYTHTTCEETAIE